MKFSTQEEYGIIIDAELVSPKESFGQHLKIKPKTLKQVQGKVS
jgi:hypothetical protein